MMRRFVLVVAMVVVAVGNVFGFPASMEPKAGELMKAAVIVEGKVLTVTMNGQPVDEDNYPMDHHSVDVTISPQCERRLEGEE